MTEIVTNLITYKLGMEAAAKIVERAGDRLMREAEKVHDAEESNYDLYEELECRAVNMTILAARIRKAARRTKGPS